jgi:hypothetical protein
MRSRTCSSNRNRTAEVSSARVAVAQTPDRELGQGPERLARVADPEHQPHGLGQQATGDEHERQRRSPIQPLRVVDDAQQRTLPGHLRQQAQHGEADEEPIRSVAGAQPEHDLQRVALRAWQKLEPVEQRPAQLMQAGVCQLHLRLHPDRPDDGRILRLPRDVFQERRLPDPGLSPHDQRPALPSADIPDEPGEHLALPSSTEQHIQIIWSNRRSLTRRPAGPRRCRRSCR